MATQRWRELAETIEDCHSILVSGVGRAPRWVMEKSGLRVIEATGLIAQAMESLHRSGDVPAAMKKQVQVLRQLPGMRGHRRRVALNITRFI